MQNIKEIVASNNLKHIAIIMDGNRRWAKEKFLATALGHQQGAKTLKNIIKYCDKIGVKYLTVYAFSTENWKRTQEEVDCLMSLFVTTLRNDLKEMHKNNVKVRFLGDREVLSEELITTMEESESLTQNNTGVNFPPFAPLRCPPPYKYRVKVLHA